MPSCDSDNVPTLDSNLPVIALRSTEAGHEAKTKGTRGATVVPLHFAGNLYGQEGTHDITTGLLNPRIFFCGFILSLKRLYHGTGCYYHTDTYYQSPSPSLPPSLSLSFFASLSLPLSHFPLALSPPSPSNKLTDCCFLSFFCSNCSICAGYNSRPSHACVFPLPMLSNIGRGNAQANW